VVDLVEDGLVGEDPVEVVFAVEEAHFGVDVVEVDLVVEGLV